MNYGMMDGIGYMGGWTGMAFGGLIMLLVVALLVWLTVVTVRWIGGTLRRGDG